MAINYPGLPQHLTNEEAGIFDLGSALQQGFKTAGMGMEAAYKPKNLAEALLHSQLQNKMIQGNLSMLPYKHRLMQAQLQKAMQDAQEQSSFNQLLSGNRPTAGSPSSSYGNMMPPSDGLGQPSIPPSADDNSSYNVSSEGFGVAPSASAYDTFPGRRKAPQNASSIPSIPMENMSAPSLAEKVEGGFNVPSPSQKILNPGNPDLYGIDELYDRYPQYRKRFHDRGLKRSQEIKTNPSTGEAYIITKDPSGRVRAESMQVGMEPRDIAREKEEGKGAGVLYNNLVNTGNSLEMQNSSLDSIIDAVESDPQARNVVGPINKYLTTWAGTPQQKDLLGRIMTGSGNILLDVSHDVKGAWTGKDMSMVNNIKANPSDPYGIFLGKLKAHRSLNELAKQRTELMSDLIDKGVKPHEAAKIAQKRVSFAPIQKQVDKLLKNTVSYNAFKSGQKPSFSSKEDFEEFSRMLTPQEKVRFVSLYQR
ncbi:MAG: hypothetical protein AB7F29_13810 [Candidatus Nitrosocosmicus sp.]